MRLNRWVVGALAGVVAVGLALGIYRAGVASSPRQEGRVAQRAGGISVSGEGAVSAKPDTAYLNLGFTAQAPSVADARRESASSMAAVIGKLKQLGVAEKDIQTSGLNIYRDQERGVFVVSNEVRVTIRDVGASSKLLDGAVAAGANSVQGLSFAIEDRAALEDQAREKALQQARAKAEKLARLGGVRLGGAVAISEGVAAPDPMLYGRALDTGGASAANMDTPIQAGQMEVRLSVQATYAIE